MTPIFVRPVREQLEHDRLIRFLQARIKSKRKFEALANVGDEHGASIRVGANTFFPDLVLMAGKKLAAVIEVETGESTNNLEAMAQWTHFSHARVPFHLYVPVLAIDAAKRLCEANQVKVSEIWSYRAVNDQFDLVRAYSDPDAVRAATKQAPKLVPAPPPSPSAAAPAAKPAVAAKTVRSAKPAKAKAKPAGKKPAARPKSKPAAKKKRK